MNNEELKNKLGKQYLIAAYIENKLQIVNYIKDGYDKNAPVLMNNKFLHFTAHVYYRSIVIDLYALLGPANINNKNAFKYIIKARPSELKSESLKQIADLLINAASKIQTIKNLRHTQMAHYDFSLKDAISLNFNDLPIINELFLLCQAIINMFGASYIKDELTIGYDFGRRHQYLDSLERLISRNQ